MTFKATWTFRMKHHGWSETLYTPGNANYASALAAAERYAVQRLKLCGAGPEIPHIRVSDIAIQGDSLVSEKKYYTTTSPNVFGGVFVKPVGGGWLSDEPWTAAIVSLTADEKVVGRIFMRGLPDEFFSGENGFDPDNNWVKQFGIWAKLLITDKWGPLVKPKMNAFGFSRITTITAVKDTPVTITAPGLIVPIGSLVTITGAKFTDGSTFSGTFRPAVGLGGVIALDYIAKRDGTHVPNTGKARAIIPFVPPTVTAVYGDSTTRKSGRPFGSQVGRRKRAFAFR